MKVSVYIDGANFYHGMKRINKRYTDTKFDFEKFIAKITKNDEEIQCNSTIILELVCNIIVFWNAKMIERILKEMKRDGLKFKITDIDYISPIITEHINKIGTYVFNLDRENPLN